MAKNERTDVVVLPSFGNTEHKIGFGATAIVDVTETGRSLHENGLKIIAEILTSHTVVVANPVSFADPQKARYINCFTRLIEGAFLATQYVLLTANVPNRKIATAAKIMGGLKAPSKAGLTRRGWHALQSIILKKDETVTITRLMDLGVTDIIVNRNLPLVMGTGGVEA